VSTSLTNNLVAVLGTQRCRASRVRLQSLDNCSAGRRLGNGLQIGLELVAAGKHRCLSSFLMPTFEHIHITECARVGRVEFDDTLRTSSGARGYGHSDEPSWVERNERMGGAGEVPTPGAGGAEAGQDRRRFRRSRYIWDERCQVYKSRWHTRARRDVFLMSRALRESVIAH